MPVQVQFRDLEHINREQRSVNQPIRCRCTQLDKESIGVVSVDPFAIRRFMCTVTRIICPSISLLIKQLVSVWVLERVCVCVLGCVCSNHAEQLFQSFYITEGPKVSDSVAFHSPAGGSTCTCVYLPICTELALS